MNLEVNLQAGVCLKYEYVSFDSLKVSTNVFDRFVVDLSRDVTE